MASTAVSKCSNTDASARQTMTNIFDIWDVHGDGYVDGKELKEGVMQFLDSKGRLTSDMRYILELEDLDVHTNMERHLGRSEFDFILSRLAKVADVSLEELASYFRERRAGSEAAAQAQAKGWHRMPDLFNLWDVDNNGRISRHELAIGIRKLRESKELRISLEECLGLMDEVEASNDQELDRREFGAFLSRLSLASGLSLDDTIEFFMKEAEKASKRYQNRHNHRDVASIHEGWKMMPMLFDTWDVDNSGTIDRSELTAGVSHMIHEIGLGVTSQQCHAIFEEVDLNNDDWLDRMEFGCFLSRFADAAHVSLDEVTCYLRKELEKSSKREIQKISDNHSLQNGWRDMPVLFQMWDTDNSGYIEREELAIGVDKFRERKRCKITLAEALHLMDEVDTNNDRVLDQMEFGAFLARFSLASGVPLDEITQFFIKDHREQPSDKTGPLKGNSLFGSFFARAKVGMAEESVETQTYRPTSARLA